MKPIILIKKTLCLKKEKASFLNWGSANNAESSRPSCLIYNRNFVTNSWNFSYICWDAKSYRFGEKYGQRCHNGQKGQSGQNGQMAKISRIAKIARMAKMAEMAIMAKFGKIVTIATFAKMVKKIKMAKKAKIAKFFVECLWRGVVS